RSNQPNGKQQSTLTYLCIKKAPLRSNGFCFEGVVVQINYTLLFKSKIYSIFSTKIRTDR
ncbi:hypothetical protein, partial [Heyndrickxia sporothermodurans]|uniref:hypothetical protein n=1 Tax=Heyndrickxia sporothermodurans TaxID=46224 RepID=UPI00196B7EBE